jgi:penicillin amidase
VETRDDILLQSIQDAIDLLTELQGADWKAWRWGALHTATFVSPPLGQSGIGLVEALVNAGPVPTSGSWDTLNRTNWNVDAPFTVQGSISSMRMILDFSDLDDSRTILTTGQSGHPFSANYRDMVDPWRLMGNQPMRFSPDSVEAGARTRLELRPSPLSHARAEAE